MSKITNAKIAGRILITGGTGSWGHELCRQLLTFSKIKEIVILSRNEHKQVEMQRKFSSKKIKFVIGDVRDIESLHIHMQQVDVVFHLAALKHVPVCDQNSWQTVQTNIIGTHNIIMSSIKENVKYVIDVSTDKAVEPHNIYGVSKACGEKLIINAQHNYSTTTKFVCIRAGNVMGTNGSVIPLFKKQILTENKVTVTDPEMTRFLMKTTEAINLIFEAINNAKGGEIFVMKMGSIRVNLIADAMIEKYGNDKTKIKIIGSRPGEKKHELLVSKDEIQNTYDFNKNFFIIVPEYRDNRFKKIISRNKSTLTREFSSEKAKKISKKDLLYQIAGEDWA